MAKKAWNAKELAELAKFARGGLPLPALAKRFGCTQAEIKAKAAEEGISLEPPRYSPYSRAPRS